MKNTRNANSRIRILLSEGSSISAREIITALGPRGHTIDICDPNPYCIGRFSSYIHRVYRCPRSGDDPVAYLKFVIKLIKEQGYDVLFPANEQAFLFAWAREYLTPLVGIAVPDFSAITHLQTKSAFMHYLDELELPHPLTRCARTRDEIQAAVSFMDKPCYIKTDYGTASTGVWRIHNDQDWKTLEDILDTQGIMNRQTEFLVQEASPGIFEQAHSIFDHGRLLALHCTRRLKEGLNGGAIIKVGVERPLVRRHTEKIGSSLKWHGSLSIDYFFDQPNGNVYYIDANPRITEPMNAVVNGLNLAEMQVQLSLSKFIQDVPHDSIVNKSHSAIQALLEAAGRRHSRLDLLKEIYLIIAKKGIYQNSRESMTPITKDFPSIMPLSGVLLQLLYNPQCGPTIAQNTIANYTLGSAITIIAAMKPEEHIPTYF